MSPKLNIIGMDFLSLLPDTETDIFLNPANIFFWDKKFLFSISSYNNFFPLTADSPISFQSFFNIKIGQEDYSFNLAYQYSFLYEKKSIFLNCHNLPIGFAYNWGEEKIGLGIGYQRFYFEKKDSLKKEKYLPFKIGFLKGEEEKLGIVADFLLYKKEAINSYQLNFTTQKTFGEITKHNFLLAINYQKELFKLISGYCFTSDYNFYGINFNTYFALKPIFSFYNQNSEMKAIFPYGITSSFGRIKFLFGFKNELVVSKEDAYLTDYIYNFGFNYRLSDNFEFYFFNLSFSSFRKWFFSIKISF